MFILCLHWKTKQTAILPAPPPFKISCLLVCGVYLPEEPVKLQPAVQETSFKTFDLEPALLLQAHLLFYLKWLFFC